MISCGRTTSIGRRCRYLPGEDCGESLARGSLPSLPGIECSVARRRRFVRSSRHAPSRGCAVGRDCRGRLVLVLRRRRPEHPLRVPDRVHGRAACVGFVQLLLADHAGPLDRRDWFGLAAAVFGLMCSGVAVAMVVAVGIATVLRRGVRVAAFHTVPAVVIYLAWYARYGRSATRFVGSPSGTVSFVRTGLAATFGAIGQVTGAGVVLGLVLVAGLALLWEQRGPSSRAERFAMPTALLLGALVFFITAAVGRTSGQEVVALPKESRYLYVAAALLIPVIGVAVDIVIRQRRALGVVGLLLLLVGIPGNVGAAVRLRPVPSARGRGDAVSTAVDRDDVPEPSRPRSPSARPDRRTNGDARMATNPGERGSGTRYAPSVERVGCCRRPSPLAHGDRHPSGKRVLSVDWSADAAICKLGSRSTLETARSV